MEYQPLKSIRQLAADQFKNFEESARLYGDLLQWAERVREYVSPINMTSDWKVYEFGILMHLASNAFLNSLVNEMKLHHFHALAVQRIGMEAIIHMAIIQTNFKKHLEVWKLYNGLVEAGDLSDQELKKRFNNIFAQRSWNKHDYSAFLSEDLKDGLRGICDFCSESGSHPNYTSATYSMVSVTNERFISGTFDISDGEFDDIGQRIGQNINTFFILAMIAAKIVEAHDQKLKYSSEKLNVIWSEWIDHKRTKAKEWGILHP